ncbi:cystatin-like [Oryzias melastigma]|uniref:cystatin-like n=1 Tax=Oryzias melastigma TaxID=30732 RepID=UPI000CF83D10|nr:cystatin-like [Oryzias melastigma]
MWKLAFLLLAALFAVGFSVDTEGFVEMKANDQGVQTALKFAMDEYNKASRDIYFYTVVKVIRVQRKFQEGYKYILTVMIERTECIKDSMDAVCPVFTDPIWKMTYQCTFVVYNSVWFQRWMLLEKKCY